MNKIPSIYSEPPEEGDQSPRCLTPEQKIAAAYFHVVRGVPQQDVAGLLGGVNPGRVAEAVVAVRNAVGAKKRRIRIR